MEEHDEGVGCRLQWAQMILCNTGFQAVGRCVPIRVNADDDN